MLVLTRKIGEQIVVPGCDLVLTVVSIQGDKVRVGINAPVEVEVHRREVWERIKAENLAAAQGSEDRYHADLAVNGN